jgi:hypothetical protein
MSSEKSIEALVEASSLGTPEAKALRESVDPALVERVMQKVREWHAPPPPEVIKADPATLAGSTTTGTVSSVAEGPGGWHNHSEGNEPFPGCPACPVDNEPAIGGKTSPTAPVSIDYGGVTPAPGDHLAIPAGLWADMCWLAGAASITMPDSPIVKRTHEAVSQVFPVVRFEAGEQRVERPSVRVEADPVAIQGWLEVDRLAAENRDLRGRIDRTLDYTDSLLRLPGLNAQLGEVLRAVHNSLCTPRLTSTAGAE